MYDESEHLRWLRMRLEAARTDRRDEGDHEAVTWLSDGIAAIEAALIRIERLRRALAISRAEGHDALMALAALEAQGTVPLDSAGGGGPARQGGPAGQGGTLP